MNDRPARAAPSVVFLNRFYWPDVAATGQMLMDLAEGLAARGWRVTVVTGRAPYDRAHPSSETAAPLPSEETRAGVRVIRVSSTGFGGRRTLARVFDYASYFVGAARHLTLGDRPDAIVAMSDPPMLVALAVLAAKLRDSSAVYWVQDLFPELAGRLGLLADTGVLYRCLAAAAHYAHRRCDLVIALGPRMRESMIQAGAHPERTTYVHNWSDSEAIRPMDHRKNAFRGTHALDGKFVVLYSGNAGRAHTFDAVLHAVRALRDEPDIVFLFVGGGLRIPELQDAVRRDRLTNVRFMDYVPRGNLGALLSAANASLVTEEPGVVGLLVPSKTYGIMASGRPLLFVGSTESDVARLVRENDCGCVVSPSDGAGLTRVIRALAADPAEASRLGGNARTAAETLYDVRLSVARWAAGVERVLEGRAGRRGGVRTTGIEDSSV